MTAGITTKTTCPYCGVGCGVLATPQADGSVKIEGDPDHPANFGRLCSKGSALGETMALDERLLYPEINHKQVSWGEALDLVATKFSESIREHGPDSVAFYASGQMLTEDYYAANKLMKGFIGTANIDTNSRLCMASSVAGHKRAFGSDTAPGTYEDLELADLIVLVGSNLAWCHPVLYQRIAAAKEQRPDMKVVLIDPRRTMSADIADLHLPIKPDGDVALFFGLLGHLAKTGRFDQNYIENYVSGMEAALENLPAHSQVLEQTGLSAEILAQFYDLFANTEKSVTVYSQGVNQSVCGTDKVNAIINCHLATGRIGKPGMGPFSVTGQPNAMGGREVGGLANMLAAHMDIENSAHRDIVKSFWKAPTIATKPGLKAVDLFKAVADGRIKALWIMATNPVDSLPDADAVREAIKACPFVVVSDVSTRTDTIAHATVKLPAAAWGEKDGTVTNSERRISRQRGFLDLPGDARPDWWHVAEVAKRMGHVSGFAWQGPSEIFAEHAALSGKDNDGTRDFDISAHASISTAGYHGLRPFQWPLPANSTKTTNERFFAYGRFYTPDRKARAVAVACPQSAASPSQPRPGPGSGTSHNWLTLNTGRIRDQWHTMTRTGQSSRLSQHLAEPFCEIHPADASRLNITDASLVELENQFGKVILRALITPRQQQGSVFAPMHWSHEYASAGRIGILVPPVVDPVSGQPASKNGAVSVRPFLTVQFGFAVLSKRPSNISAPYWALAKTIVGWRVELGFESVVEDMDSFAKELFQTNETAQTISYRDAASGQGRVAIFDGTKLCGALFLAPEPVAVSRTLLTGELSAVFDNPSARFRVIAGKPGATQIDKGAIVCSCFSVGANEINAVIRSGRCSTVASIGKVLNAGTNCGSCRAEIAGLINARQPLAIDEGLGSGPVNFGEMVAVIFGEC
ncbi:MAG: molybdopterin-dependent oxidoreductase [Rhizobiaceae bacterium]